MSETGETVMRRRGKIILLVVLGFIIAVALTVFTSVLLIKNSGDGAKEAESEEVVQRRILKQISGMYMVPADEKPTVAAIKDKSQLPDQEFFKDAQQGDFLVVYPKAQLALLYREAVNKFVRVGPIALPPKTTDEQ